MFGDAHRRLEDGRFDVAHAGGEHFDPCTSSRVIR
jgi:hypothetical protein